MTDDQLPAVPDKSDLPAEILTPSLADPAIAPQLRAVEAARSKLVNDIEMLDSEVRLEVLFRMESFAWKAVAGVAAAAAGVAATKLLGGIWAKLIPDHDPPDNPADPDTSTKDAIVWTALTGVGVGVATVLAQRGAAKGWSKATGRVPPAFEKKA